MTCDCIIYTKISASNLMERVVRWSDNVLNSIICDSKSFRPLVFQSDEIQTHRHLHGQLCLLSTHSEQSRDPFTAGVASEHPSMKKIFESPKAPL